MRALPAYLYHVATLWQLCSVAVLFLPMRLSHLHQPFLTSQVSVLARVADATTLAPALPFWGRGQ